VVIAKSDPIMRERGRVGFLRGIPLPFVPASESAYGMGAASLGLFQKAVQTNLAG